MIRKGIDFLESHSFRLGLITWQSEATKGADIPDIPSINRYFGSWAVFNSVVRNSYSDPDFEFDPSETDLKGYSSTRLPARELKRSSSNIPKPVIETSLEEIIDNPMPKPIAKKVAEKPFRILDSENSVKPNKKPAVSEVRQSVSKPSEPVVKKQYAGPDLKKESSERNLRWPSLVVGVGAAAALLAIYMGFGIKQMSEQTSSNDDLRPAVVHEGAPALENKVLKGLKLQENVPKVAAAPDSAEINTAEIEVDPVVPDLEDLADVDVPRHKNYKTIISRIRNSRPKSLVPEYNLSPDAKDPVSVQGLINTAYFEGTREYADANDEIIWNGGNSSDPQADLADKWLKDYVGTKLEELDGHRDEEFTPEFIKQDKSYIMKDNQGIPTPANDDSYDKTIEKIEVDGKNDKAA